MSSLVKSCQINYNQAQVCPIMSSMYKNLKAFPIMSNYDISFPMMLDHVKPVPISGVKSLCSIMSKHVQSCPIISQHVPECPSQL